jgi:hypothetical protein
MRTFVVALLLTVSGYGGTVAVTLGKPAGGRGVFASTEARSGPAAAPVRVDTVRVDATVAHREFPGDNTGLDSIATVVRFAKRIEAWRLKPDDTTVGGIEVIGRSRDDWRAPDLDREEQGEFETVLRAAEGSTAPCTHDRCLVWPTYRLTIYDEVAPPLNMVMTGECVGWSFSRGDRRLFGYCGVVPEVAKKRLLALVGRVFHEKNGE